MNRLCRCGRCNCAPESTDLGVGVAQQAQHAGDAPQHTPREPAATPPPTPAIERQPRGTPKAEHASPEAVQEDSAKTAPSAAPEGPASQAPPVPAKSPTCLAGATVLDFLRSRTPEFSILLTAVDSSPPGGHRALTMATLAPRAAHPGRTRPLQRIKSPLMLLRGHFRALSSPAPPRVSPCPQPSPSRHALHTPTERWRC